MIHFDERSLFISRKSAVQYILENPEMSLPKGKIARSYSEKESEVMIEKALLSGRGKYTFRLLEVGQLHNDNNHQDSLLENLPTIENTWIFQVKIREQLGSHN